MVLKDFRKFIEARSEELSWVKSTLQNLFDNSLLRLDPIDEAIKHLSKLLPQVIRYGDMKSKG